MILIRSAKLYCSISIVMKKKINKKIILSKSIKHLIIKHQNKVLKITIWNSFVLNKIFKSYKPTIVNTNFVFKDTALHVACCWVRKFLNPSRFKKLQKWKIVKKCKGQNQRPIFLNEQRIIMKIVCANLRIQENKLVCIWNRIENIEKSKNELLDQRNE